MLTAKQVAETLGLSVAMIYKMSSSGQIRSYKFGSSIRFDPEDVKEFKCQSLTTRGTKDSAFISAKSLTEIKSRKQNYFLPGGQNLRQMLMTGQR